MKLTPDVDLVCVVTATKNQFWRPVVAGNDVGCVQALRRHDFRTAKVADLDDSLLIAQDVLGLQISVADALLVDEGHTGQNLAHEVLDITDRYGLIDFLRFFDDFFEVLTAILKNKVLDLFALLVL